MKKNVTLLMAVALVMSMILAGCTSSTSSEDEEGSKSNELVLAIGGESESGFDPTSGWGRYGSPLFQSTLLTRNSDLQIGNDLATDYQISDDGRVWTVKLRGDVKFSDGTPLTSSDVQYTFEKAAASGSVIDLTSLDKVEALDEQTVQFTLKQSQSTFVHLLATTGIVPKHAHGDNYFENPIGSGPYQLVQWDKGQQLIVQANPEYYGKKPFFQKITFLFLKEDAAFAAAKAGQADMAAIPAVFSKQEVPGMRLEAVESVDNRGIMLPFAKSGGKTADGHPIGNDVTSDIAIRKAINVAVDRNALVDGVLEGHGTPAFSSADKLPWWNPDTVIKDASVEEAKEILARSGWTDTDGDGIVEKGDLKAEFTIVYPASDVTRQSLAIAVSDMLRPAGIHMVVEGKSWDDIGAMMYSNAVMFGWGSHDPLEMYNLYSGKTAGFEYYNTGYYSNPVVDDYLEKAIAAAGEKEAIEFWKKAQWDGKTGFSAKGDAPWAWLVNIDHLYLVKDGLDIGKQSIHPHGHGWPVTSNIVEWKWE